MSRIQVECWAFWSPESTDPAGWIEHWRRAGARAAEGNPPGDAIPPMQRRRMSRLARMALSCALDVAGDTDIDYSIFCSQHGEVVRTRDILSSISKGVEISPTAFSQSVHNTSSGLFTILTKSHHASTSIASGANSFAHAWMEAESYLAANPAHTVLLVDFDEVIPVEYHSYSEQVECDHALALLLRAPGDGGISISRDESARESHLPQGPQFLAWLQEGDGSLTLGADGQGWRWAR
ncbi:MAG: beta-ketoacyl synthase chain length factor [Woeseiaceae bacterium]